MVIWYISKYILVPGANARGTRQYYLSKYMSRSQHDVCIINSVSCGFPSNFENYKSHFYGFSKQIERLKIYTLRGPQIGLGFNTKRLFSWIVFEIMLFFFILFGKKPRPDVVIVSSLSLITMLNGILAKYVYHAKLVFEIRDIWPKSLVDIGKWSPRHPVVYMLDKIESLGFRKADIIVGSMNNLVQHVKEKSPSNANKVRWVSMGYDPEEMVEFSDRNTDGLAIPENKFLVTYAGTIGILNLVDEVVKSAIRLKENKEIHFIVVGDGPHKANCMALAEGLSNISFLGNLPKKKLLAVLEKSDLLVHPSHNVSIFRYGISPNKWIDYMLSGKPFISMYNGYPSFINEAQCGEFTDAHDIEQVCRAILKYYDMPKEELKRIGENGKQYAKNNLSYVSLAEKYLTIIENRKES